MASGIVGASGQFIVVVAVDESKESQLAFEHGLALAKARDDIDTLHVVHAVDGFDPMGQMEVAAQAHQYSLDKERAQFDARLKELLEGVENPPKIVPHVLMGPPSKEVVRIANRVKADLIIIGSHDRGGFKRLVLGSVAGEVLRIANCSVLVFRPKSWRDAS